MRFRSSVVSYCFAILFLAASITTPIWSQQYKDQATKANTLWEQNRRLEALPLYEELAKAHPDESIFQERLADCLIVAAGQTSNPEEIASLRRRARDAAKRAVELGDTIAYIVELSRLNPDAPPTTSSSPGAALLAEGEKAFVANDIETAMKKYEQAAEADPHLYMAPLFAGDIAYRQKDLANAAKWFARAISIDPNCETAYRYWGDAIFKLGNDPDAAREKYIEAVIAEPYNLKSRQMLQKYADSQKIVLAAPKINRPAGPSVDPKKPNNINIMIDAASVDDKKNPGGAAWMMYSLLRAGYRGDAFKKAFPNEKAYRHSLEEESMALSAVAESIDAQKIKKEKLDESLRNVIELKQAGMLDCWILLNGADEGIAKDYEAYRKDHRQLLHDYINKFILHGVGVSARH